VTRLAATTLALAGLLAACGVKAPPRPPEARLKAEAASSAAPPAAATPSPSPSPTPSERTP
jgi:hypothetical protein